jgi:hypothetical protein
MINLMYNFHCKLIYDAWDYYGYVLEDLVYIFLM